MLLYRRLSRSPSDGRHQLNRFTVKPNALDFVSFVLFCSARYVSHQEVRGSSMVLLKTVGYVCLSSFLEKACARDRQVARNSIQRLEWHWLRRCQSSIDAINDCCTASFWTGRSAYVTNRHYCETILASHHSVDGHRRQNGNRRSVKFHRPFLQCLVVP